MKSILTTIVACLVLLSVNAQDQIEEAEFYIDQDPGFGNATAIDLTSGETINESFTTSFADLEAGKYFAYVRVKGENENWSIPIKMPFQVQRGSLPDIALAEWFIGNDPGFGSANTIDLEAGQTVQDAVSAETTQVEAGRNFAYLRFRNEDGDWSLPLKQPFNINDKLPLDVVAAEYFIDEDPGIGAGIPIEVDADHFVDESYLAEVAVDLEIGDHFLYTRVQNEEGDWSINVVRTFSVGTVSTEDEALLNSTSVYPIPARDFLFVQNERFSILEVRLFDTNGRIVKVQSWQGRRLDLSDLSAGIYLLRITTEAGGLTRRIVVE